MTKQKEDGGERKWSEREKLSLGLFLCEQTPSFLQRGSVTVYSAETALLQSESKGLHVLVHRVSHTMYHTHTHMLTDMGSET